MKKKKPDLAKWCRKHIRNTKYESQVRLKDGKKYEENYEKINWRE